MSKLFRIGFLFKKLLASELRCQSVMVLLLLGFIIQSNTAIGKTENNTLSLLSNASIEAESLQEQIRQVSGKVSLASATEGEITVPGVNVHVKGTTVGAITDAEGFYSIDVAPGNVLVFSFIGFVSEEINVSNQTTINVLLREAYRELDEFVVIGYGVQRKSDLTGSVATVSSESLNRGGDATIERALQGKASGVLVTQTSGDPGAAPSIMIRGIGSINRSTQPLYVVDNVPVGGLREISPEDIESIQILKDASATAIYGARGANGVVLIKTKRGSKSDKLNVDFSSYLRVSDFPRYRRYDVMNADEYVDFLRKAHEENPSRLREIFTNDSLRAAYGNVSTDWQDELLRVGIGQNHYLRLSGGGTDHNFSVSANYYTEEGVLINSSMDRFTVRANSDFDLFDGIVSIGKSVLIGNSKTDGTSAGSNLALATYTSPLMPVFEPKNIGGYAGPTDSITGNNDSNNPVAPRMLNTAKSDNLRFIANYYLEVKPFDGFNYRLNIGNEYSPGRYTRWTPVSELGNIGSRSNTTATLLERSRTFKSLMIENLFTYSKNFNGHFVSLLAGHTIQNDLTDIIEAEGRNFRDDKFNVLSQAESVSRKVGEIIEHKMESYLARLLYDYEGKYLLTASFRRDGSSRFGPYGNRYANFPSFSAGWKLNEDLLPDVDQINMLKLRFGWGVTGNMNIGDYSYETYLTPPNQSRYVFGNTTHWGATDLRSTGNRAIKWEEAEMTNFGLDFRGFEGSFDFSAEYYIKNQHDMLVRVTTPLSLGKDFDDPSSNPWVNLGQVQNKGFEFNATYRKVVGDFYYSVSGVLTTIHNKVVSLPEGTPIFTEHTITAEGYSIGSFYGLVAEGIFQSQEEIDAHATQKARTAPGDIKFKDLNFDGRINDEDRTVIGKPTPDLTYGVNFEMEYKGFDFSVFLNGMHNLHVYNEHYANIGLATDRNAKDFNRIREAMDYWTTENPSTTMTRVNSSDPNVNSAVSSWFVHDASFLRLQTIQLGYNLPENILRRANINRLRVYVTGSHLHVFTNYKGYDPEVGSTNVLSMGIDRGNYPIPRSFLFGVQIGL